MTTDTKPEALLWIDTETTGLDPEHDQLLEIALRCTDPNAETTHGACHRIIRPHHLDLTAMDPTVFTMHTDNGLLHAIVDADPQTNSPEAARNAIEEYIESLAQRFHLIPAGSNPAFDLAFTHTAGYRIEHLLDHRRYDLDTIRWHHRFTNQPDPYADRHHTSHRAPDCIQRDINEHRHTIQKETNQ